MAEPLCLPRLGSDAQPFFRLALLEDGRADPASDSIVFGDDRNNWIVITPPQARLHPDFTSIVHRQSQLRPDVDIFYGDEVVLGRDSQNYDPVLKSALDVTHLIAADYIGLPLIVRATAMSRLGGLTPELGTAVCYDLLLRAISAGLGIERIAQTLAAHPAPRPQASAADRRKVLDRWLDKAAGKFAISDGLVDGTFRLERRFADFPEVTIIIPTRQDRYPDPAFGPSDQQMIIGLLDRLSSIDWPMDRLNVLVGDALEDDRIYRGRDWPFRWRRIVVGSADNATFNYAAKANVLWRAADTEHLIFMNDDINFGFGGWLKALCTFSMMKDVGAVGARLLYPNGTIQHAGMPGGLFGMTAHAWLGQPADAATYQNWGLVHREWSMVTGAVLATRKSVLNEINGFDERFRLEFNDVDLCLRMRMLGYRIVYTPFAELVHYEKASRAATQPRASELARFLKRWRDFLDQDPAYHPELTRDSFQIGPVASARTWWCQPAPDDEKPVAPTDPSRRSNAPMRHTGLQGAFPAIDPAFLNTGWRTTGQSDDRGGRRPTPPTVAVAYLARGADPDSSAAFQRFVASYRKFPAGRDHRLYILYKGFENTADLHAATAIFSELNPQARQLDDWGFDIGAYIAAAGQLEEDYVCFVNTYSELLDAGWLEKLASHLDRDDVGLVGSSGSFEAFGDADPGFPPFPNAHLRSNGFMIERQLFMSFFSSLTISNKRDAYLIESGPESLTRRVAAMGLKVLVVGRNGRGYSPLWWPSSDTFRQGTQANLLIGDNKTRAFIDAGTEEKRRLIQLAWGDYLDPADILATRSNMADPADVLAIRSNTANSTLMREISV